MTTRRRDGVDDPPAPRAGDRGWGSLPVEGIATSPMLYQSAYLWLVLVSTMDLLLTWVILAAGGSEVNPIARVVIDAGGLPGAITFKYALVVFVILVCEIAGRSRDRTGRGLAYLAVAVSAIPVVYSLLLIVYHLVNRGPLPIG
jgi:hypothetical protein